jgi:3-deoxy-D-manno-octulosonate 8-phosphate phosphatase (KDO 8-P phosphatase)
VIGERLARIRALVLDVDGVLTDGTLYYGEHGEMLKAFHVHDGLGMKLLLSRDIAVAVISAKRSKPLLRRLDDLGVSHRLGREDKLTALDELLGDLGLEAEDVAYAGDDLIDLPVMARVGLAIAVPNARPQVVEAADWITETCGGCGAVREMAERILEVRGELDAAIAALVGELS